MKGRGEVWEERKGGEEGKERRGEKGRGETRGGERRERGVRSEEGDGL